jgi:hypothetical protein
MKAIILTISLLFFNLLVYAQTFGGGGPSFSPDVLDNPIDGGLGILLGAGVAFGAKKLRDHRKSKKKSTKKEI